MPFKSKRQQRWMFAEHPEMAKRWARHTPSIKSLPETAGGTPDEEQAPADKAASTGEGSLMANLLFEEKVIDTFQAAAAALEKAEASERDKQAQAHRLASRVPEAVDALIRHGRFESDAREKLAVALQDPEKVMEILIKVAAHRNVEESSHLGAPVPAAPNTRTKAAAYGSVDSPYCGGRTSQQKPSELALLRGLGLA